MTDLSPAAQAVLDAANKAYDQAGTVAEGTAAALRAAADQPYDVPAWIQGDAYWNYRNGADAERERLLAIADELESKQ
jgi:hypothetical protein